MKKGKEREEKKTGLTHKEKEYLPKGARFRSCMQDFDQSGTFHPSCTILPQLKALTTSPVCSPQGSLPVDVFIYFLAYLEVPILISLLPENGIG